MTPDEQALDVVRDVTAATFDVLHAWPVNSTDPRPRRLAQLVEAHGVFTPLSVLLGWIAVELRAKLDDEPDAPLTNPTSGQLTWTLYYRAPARSRDLLPVVARLLGYVVDGSADALARLHDAAGLLRTDPHETSRVLVAVFDLCLALREDRVALVRHFEDTTGGTSAGEGA